MLRFLTPAAALPETEEARRREVEAVVARFRVLLAVFATAFTILEPGPEPALRWAAAVLLFLSAAFSFVVLRRPLTVHRIQVVAGVTVLADTAVVGLAMFSDTGRFESSVYLVGVLLVFEAAVRWAVAGGLGLAGAMSLLLGAWMAYREARHGIPFRWDALVFRSAVFLATGLAVGVLVRALNQARASFRRRLAESEVVHRFALRVPSVAEEEATALLVEMLHQELGFEEVGILLHGPDRLGLAAAAGEDATRRLGEPDVVDLANACLRAGRPHVRTVGHGASAHSTLAVPLRAGARRIGVLVVTSRRPDAFDDDEARLLETLAGELAQLLEHARLGRMQTETIEDLQRLAAAKDDFVATTSHELRTPLTALRGFAGALAERRSELTPEQEQRAIDAIDRQVERLATLVEDLLAASLIESGRSAPTLEGVDVASVARDAMTEVAAAVPDRELRLQGDGADCRALADRSFLHRVLVNLLSNAVRYSDDAVDVVVGRRDDRVAVEVRDRGPGIGSEDRERLFEKFVRLGPEGGSGLGLFIVKGLVEAMGGEVGVESEPGTGSRFHVELASASPAAVGRGAGRAEPDAPDRSPSLW